MQVYGQWWGGSNYVMGGDETIEVFDSIRDAKNALRVRRDQGCDYYTPVVGDDSVIWLYFADPTGSGDQYPDRIIKFGPRGGVVVERV